MIGCECWALAEGYIPSGSHGVGRAFEGHETACMLNGGDREAKVPIEGGASGRQAARIGAW
jgi:hypothetical protein